MSYCKCGGYLGDGGPSLYAGRFCSCANPVLQNVTLVTTNNLNIIPDEAYNTYDLANENTQLRKKLDEAISILEFYGNRFSWEWSKHHTHEYYSGEIKENDSSLVEYTEADGDIFKNHCGGKRAREFLAKVKK